MILNNILTFPKLRYSVRGLIQLYPLGNYTMKRYVILSRIKLLAPSGPPANQFVLCDCSCLYKNNNNNNNNKEGIWSNARIGEKQHRRRGTFISAGALLRECSVYVSFCHTLSGSSMCALACTAVSEQCTCTDEGSSPTMLLLADVGIAPYSFIIINQSMVSLC